MVVPGNVSHREILCDEVPHGKVFTRGTNWRTLLLILYIVCMSINLFCLHTSRTCLWIFLQTSVVVYSTYQTCWYYQTYYWAVFVSYFLIEWKSDSMWNFLYTKSFVLLSGVHTLESQESEMVCGGLASFSLDLFPILHNSTVVFSPFHSAQAAVWNDVLYLRGSPC